MKKLIFFISLCLFISYAASAQTLQSRVNKVVETVNKNEAEIKGVKDSVCYLYKRFNDLDFRIKMQESIITQEQTAIDNSLCAANYHISIFSYIVAVIGVLITLLGFGLGVYISKKQKNVEYLLKIVEDRKNDVELLNTKIEETSRTIQQLNDDINNNIEGLYQRLRREETKVLLNRLVRVPFDITNLSDILMSRVLQLEDFNTLLTAYTSFKQECEDESIFELVGQVGDVQRLELSSKGQYLILFYQNFCGQSMLNDSIREDIIEFLPHALRCAFKNDIKDSLTSLINTLNDNDIQGRNEDILMQYIIALYKSDKSTYNEPYKIMVDICNSSINLRNVWDKLVQSGLSIESFGNLLCDRYRNDSEFVTKVKEQIETSKKDEKKENESDSK